MVKVSDPNKIAMAKKLLPDHSFTEINKMLKEEFGSSLGHNTLVKLNKELKEKPLKDNIEIVIKLFKKALKIKGFSNIITDSEIEAIEFLEGSL